MNYLQFFFLIVTFGLNISSCFACDLLNVNAGGFGQIEAGGEIQNRQIANLELRCDMRFRVGLDGGLNYSGVRRMSNGKGNFISYHLWQDSASNVEWGSKGTATVVPHPADSFSGKGNGSIQSFPIYGTYVLTNHFPPGVYTDTVRVVLVYSPFDINDYLEADLHVSFEVVGNCTLSIVGLGNFGEWPAGSPDLEGVPLGSITVNCNPPGMTYAVGIGGGMNMRDSVRHMRSGDDLVPYVLYSDSVRDEQWGDSGLSLIEPSYVETHPAAAQTAISTGTIQNFSVWGDAMLRTSPSGSYRDTVSVTIVWQ